MSLQKYVTNSCFDRLLKSKSVNLVVMYVNSLLQHLELPSNEVNEYLYKTSWESTVDQSGEPLNRQSFAKLMLLKRCTFC